MKSRPVFASMLLVSISFCFSSAATAQLSDASLFPELRSTNPAVISRRSDKHITALARAEFTKKNQTLATANGDSVNADATTDVNVNSISVFRGGQGPGFTTELEADYVLVHKPIRRTRHPSRTKLSTTRTITPGTSVSESMNISASVTVTSVMQVKSVSTTPLRADRKVSP